jgi:hypothetical protein
MQHHSVVCAPVPLIARVRFLVLLFSLCLSWLPAQADEWHFSDVDRIVAVGDVHGAYDALVATLQEADVIDSDLNWSGGKTHLVSTGDLLDRGPKSRAAMDLFIRLENQALLAGGRVHLMLGNHEVMNLTGDLRYVSNEEYAAFLDDESPEEREHWYQLFRRSKPADSDESAVRWEFDQKAPPGYFGHRRAFRHDGYYGKWLLQKPIIVVVNETAFVHGGLPPYVAEHGLTGINEGLKKDLIDYVVTRGQLADADTMSPIDRFKDIKQFLPKKLNSGEIAYEFVGAARSIIDLGNSPLHGPVGPTWYRGTASCNKLIEGDSLNIVLDAIGANRIVMGHTVTITRQVQQRMNGRIVEIDTGMLNSSYGGSGNALVIEGHELSVVNEAGAKSLPPIGHPVRVGHESIAIDENELEVILANGRIVESGADGAGWRLVRVKSDQHSVHALFRELSEEQRSAPELAAYRLDRMLGLGMVPATVRRSIAGRAGTLQFVPAETLSERERVASGKFHSAPCPLQKQLDAMYVFDGLIRNTARTPSSMLYSLEDLLLLLVDHELSFGTEEGLPTNLEDFRFVIGDQWRSALSGLNDEMLRLQLGDVLDDDQLVALQNRRDALLEKSPDSTREGT